MGEYSSEVNTSRCKGSSCIEAVGKVARMKKDILKINYTPKPEYANISKRGKLAVSGTTRKVKKENWEP